MTIWDEIADLFKSQDKLDEEKQQRIKEAKLKEQSLLNELEKLDKEYKSTVPEYKEKDYENILPKFNKTEKVDNTLSDKQLKDIASSSVKDSYNDELNKIKDTFNKAIKSNEEKKQNALIKSKADLYNIVKMFEQNDNNIDNNMSKKGLHFSSINSGLKNKNLSDYDKQFNDNKNSLNSYLSKLQKDNESSTFDKDFQTKNLDNKTKDNYKKLLEQLTDKRDNERMKISSYNEDLKLEEAKYNNNLNKLISELKQKDRKAYEDSLKFQQQNEEKYGYTGDKKLNYDKRLKLAIDFYNTLPKETALDVAKNNPSLKSYLGEYYDDLIGTISSRHERKSIFS